MFQLTGWLWKNKLILALSGCALLNPLIYGFSFLPMANLLEYYPLPRLNLYTLPQGGYPGLYRVILAFLMLGLVYWLGWRLAQQAPGKAAWMLVLGSSLASSAALLFMYPYGAADIFDNILRGRLLGIYGDNPFLPPGAQRFGDPLYPYIAWKGWPTAYGPGWEALAGLAARLAGNGVIANVIVFKMLPGVFLWTSLALAALILRKKAPQEALAGVLLLAWNPVVLYETWGNGHNDMAMVFWIIAAAWAAYNRWYTLAILALVAGALFKFIPVLLIPPTATLAFRGLRLPRQRWLFLGLTALLTIVLIYLAYAPFWEGLQSLNLRRRTQLYTSSLPSMVYYLLLYQAWGKTQAAELISRTALSLTVFFIFWKCWRLWRNPSFDEYAEGAAQILLFYLLVTCLWFQSWYALWPASLLPLLKPGLTRQLVLLTSFATLSKPLGIGPILFWPKPSLTQPGLEIRFTLGVLGLPWLYWLIATIKSKYDQSTS
jgi:hypothetical protein